MERLAADTGTGESRRLTPPSATVDEGELVEPSVERYASFDGESIPVFVFEPRGVERPPVVLEIHGGPESQRQLTWMPLVQYLVASGFAVAQPNVRGSTGYGKRFEHLDDVRLRLDSVRDLARSRTGSASAAASTSGAPCSTAARTAAT